MKLSELSAGELARRTSGEGTAFECGPFVVRVISPIPAIEHGLGLLYGDYPLHDSADFADVQVRLVPRRRVLVEPQVILDFDGEHPFTPLPLDHAWPMFEWSFNWCIATSANYYLILHAAVIERGGRALVMPGPPGSGKSTLAAALIARDWRLLSDELALVDTGTRGVVPIPRPISLKNQSIPLIQNRFPGAVVSHPVHNTQKGSVAHLKVPADHIRRAQEMAQPGWAVFPKYTAGVKAQLIRRSRADTMLEFAYNSFNYHVQGRHGFDVLADMVQSMDCYNFEYSDLDEAIALLDRILV
jgi:hypothetical protein